MEKHKPIITEQRSILMYNMLCSIVERYEELQSRNATNHDFACAIYSAQDVLEEVRRKCIKRLFRTQEECNESIAANDVGVDLRSYECPECGFWHKTKHPSKIDEQTPTTIEEVSG